MPGVGYSRSKLRPIRPAFTLVELLVVLAIIALLIGILVPAIGSARRVARQTVDMSNMRQMLLGYRVYQAEHGGWLMWGYPPAYVDGQPLSVKLPSGHKLPGSRNALPVMRYPIRLAPYEQGVWELLYSHTDSPEPPTSDDSIEDAYTKAYKLSTNPSFGLNTVFVGGDLGHEGFVSPPRFRPNTGSHVAFRDVEIERPGSMIVFAESKLRGGGMNSGDEGLHRVTPPLANGRQWQARDEGFEIVNTGGVIGLPEGRYGAQTITGFFDGHVDRLSADELDDMRLWANRADHPNYDYR